MEFIEAGNKPNSYLLKIFGLKIRFRNIFAFRGNKILFVDKEGNEKKFKPRGLKVKFLGSNSVVKIYHPAPRFINTSITCENNALVSIKGSKYHIRNFNICMSAPDSVLNIGENCFIRGGNVVIKDKNGLNVDIGNNCLIAQGVSIRTTDFHTVYDEQTKEVLNTPENVKIGNHCWLCEDVLIAKGAILADNTIAAARAYITKKFSQPNTIIGGLPAKIIKENTNWDFQNYERYVGSSSDKLSA